MTLPLDQNRVRQLFDYNPKTGDLYWRSRPQDEFSTKRAWAAWNARFAGTVAGYKNPRGYITVTIDGYPAVSHRIIWLHVYGEWPDQIDHIDGIHDDNRLENLRDVSGAENARNRPRLRNNTSGVTGVTRHRGKWVAKIGINNWNYHLGIFDDIEDAIAARKAAEEKHGFHANHGRIAA